MTGAVLGDIIGSPYEFDMGDKTKNFPLFSKRSEFTDDSVMTVAVAESLLDSEGAPDEEIRKSLLNQFAGGGRNIPMRDTACGSTAGFIRRIRCHTGASATARQ